MSRSNPTANAPNPSSRYYEWTGEKGTLRYYDKTAKENKDVALPFTFLLLDELATVRGWHDASSSGIYSNEVRDTTKDDMVVKAFKGGTLAEGRYRAIKDRVNAQGGKFTTNCYVAAKDDTGALGIACVQFKGAALQAWMEFRKTNRASLYEQAVKLVGFTEGKKGRIVFRVPKFELKPVSDETNAQATKLDKTLQGFLEGYLQKRTHDQAEARDDRPGSEESGDPVDDMPLTDDDFSDALTDDDIPF